MRNLKSILLSGIMFFLSLALSNSYLFSQPLEELEELKEEKPKTEEKAKPTEEKKEEKKVEQKIEELAPMEEKKVEQVVVKSTVAGIPDDIYIPEDVRPLFKEKYEYLFDASFETVYVAILKSIEERGCQVASKNPPTTDDKGLQKANIKSDDCVFSIGEDSTFKVLRKFSLTDDKVEEVDGKKVTKGKGLPGIRGGKWLNGRLKYNFRVQEQNDGKTLMTLKTEMSGFEDYVVHEVLFWSSNGVKEAHMLNTLFAHLRKAKTE